MIIQNNLRWDKNWMGKKECIVYAFKPWEDLKKNQRADPVNM